MKSISAFLSLLCSLTFPLLIQGQDTIPHAPNRELLNKLAHLAQLEEKGDLAMAVSIAGQAANLYLQSGEMDSALVMYRKKARLAGIINDLVALGDALSAQSEILYFRNQYQERLKINQRLYRVNIAQNELAYAAAALGRIGDSYRCLGILDSALLYSQKAIDEMPADAPPNSILYVKDIKARTLLDLSSFEEAMAIFLENLKILEADQDTFRMVPVLNNICSSFINQKEFRKAKEFAMRASALLEHTNMPLNKAANLKLLGIIHFQQEQPEKALQYLQSSLAIYSARNNHFHIADVNYRIGLILAGQGKTDQAILKYEAALGIFRRVKDAGSILNTELAYAQALTQKSEFEKATTLLNKCLQDAKRTGQLANLRSTYLVLSNTYSAQENYQAALENHRRFHQINDSLFNGERLKIVNELEAKYQFERTRRDILELEQANALRATAIKAQKQLSLALGAGVLVLAGLTLFFYRNLQKNKLIARQQTALDQQKIKELEQEKELTTLRAMIKGQNQERKRIAHDLHDSLGGLLSTVKLRFDAARTAVFSATQKQAFEKGNELLDKACTEVRNIAHNLMPESIAKFGLHTALEDLCDALQETTASKINFQTVNLPQQIEETQALNLYRIVQELLHNAVKYAQASDILIQLSQQQDNLHLTVEDNGVGFDLLRDDHWGMGLKSVRSRVRYLGGTLEVESFPGQGTAFHISAQLDRVPDVQPNSP